jgi:hypothetical protein
MASQFLDDEDRTLVQLRAVDELDWPAIGLAVGLAPDAARMRYQRLLPRLANYVRKLREGKIDELLVEESERAPS